MIYFLIVLLALASLTAIAAIVAVGYLYGQNEALIARLTEGRRRERRLTRLNAVYQDKMTQKAGMGTITKRITSEKTETFARRIVGASEAINRAKQVPPAVKEKFIAATRG